jgi:AcrR family transcriptional regulator
MKHLLTNIQLKINDSIFQKDPMSSELGVKIISGSIDLIFEQGFEQFTFKKLAAGIESTEASVYRYFENKHKLLLYLTNWYWCWMELNITFNTVNLPVEQQFNIAIEFLTKEIKEDSNYNFINVVKLHKIVINESSKAFLTHEVDADNKLGAYRAYKELVALISSMILQINPNFKYPQMLVSTVVEGAHNQRFFAEHLPGLTNTLKGEDAIVNFYTNMVFTLLKNEK